MDVWAIGVLTFELLEGRCPFELDTSKDTIKEIMRGCPTFPSWMSEEVVSFIKMALTKVRWLIGWLIDWPGQTN